MGQKRAQKEADTVEGVQDEEVTEGGVRGLPKESAQSTRGHSESSAGDGSGPDGSERADDEEGGSAGQDRRKEGCREDQKREEPEGERDAVERRCGRAVEKAHSQCDVGGQRGGMEIGGSFGDGAWRKAQAKEALSAEEEDRGAEDDGPGKDLLGMEPGMVDRGEEAALGREQAGSKDKPREQGSGRNRSPCLHAG